MYKDIPVPQIVITISNYTAENGTKLQSALIESRVTPEIYNGFMVLDDPEHLFLVRDAVDAAIDSLELTRPDNLPHPIIKLESDETEEE